MIRPQFLFISGPHHFVSAIYVIKIPLPALAIGWGWQLRRIVVYDVLFGRIELGYHSICASYRV